MKALFLFLILALFPLTGVFSQISLQKDPGLSSFDLDPELPLTSVVSDPVANRLFLLRGKEIQIFDTDTSLVTGAISGFTQVQKLAIVPDLHRAFVTDSDDSSVSVVDTDSNKIKKTIRILARNPGPVVYDPKSQRVFIFSKTSGFVSVLDSTSYDVLGNLFMRIPATSAVLGEDGQIFALLNKKDSIGVINAAEKELVDTWSVKPGVNPQKMIFDKDNHLILAICENQTVVILNSTNGQVLSSMTLDKPITHAVYNSIDKKIYGISDKGQLTGYQIDSHNTLKAVDLPYHLDTEGLIALDSKTQRLILATPASLSFIKLNTKP